MLQADSVSTTSRRNFMSAAAVAAVVAPIGAEAALQTPPDWIGIIEKAFDDAEASVAAHCFMHRNAKGDEDEDELTALVDRQRVIIDHILWLKATDIRGLRLKARAVLWANEELSHLKYSETDCLMTKSIITSLLNLSNS